MPDRSLLVLTAHPGDFVWRAGGAIALASERGERAVIGCMSFGERGSPRPCGARATASTR